MTSCQQFCSRFARQISGPVALLLVTTIFGCADLRQHAQEANFTAGNAAAPRMALARDIRLSFPDGFQVPRVAAGTAFIPMGSIGQGTVLRPVQTVILLADGANYHEADLVVANGTIVGLYMPVEELFLKATVPVPTEFKEMP